ncbi:MAG: proline--tRNA ligase [Eubacteriales bacterium]|nr:proline--tRNA ligase [Eubacteriales bacterium]
MRMSKMYFRTLREDPSEAVIPSHKMLIRAGFIRKEASGLYSYMQPGWRVLRKISQIVREEMDEKGAQEIYVPILTPKELWEDSGRWNDYGPEMWRVTDRHGREFCLGPTHEETFTDIVRTDISSYKQLPFFLYQIQPKYRDEERPRFGLLRSREFFMKDAYSFDVDQEGLDRSYDIMYDAYNRIFNRLSLTFKPVEADTGAIGGSNSHEFTAFSEVGESDIVLCDNCGLAATVEKAECVDAAPQDDVEMLPLEEVETPGTKTIDLVAEYLGLDKKQTIKALLFVTYDEETMEENGYVAAFCRGDREVNMTKLVNALGIPEHCIAFADEHEMSEATGCVGGFTGPKGLHDCTIVVDSELPGLKNLCAGACHKDHHYINMNYGRDYTGDIIADIKLTKEGDPCPCCGKPVHLTKGIEVGQIFKLGTKYSESMGAYYSDENQQRKPIVMGCYGIGISRTLSAIVEQNHDENGIIWPVAVAPFHVIITVMKPKDEEQMRLASEVEEALKKEGLEVLTDDRKERPGVKFKDADLIGIPVQITIGRRAGEGVVEYKLRREEEKQEIPAKEAIRRAVDLVRKEGDGRCFIK